MTLMLLWQILLVIACFVLARVVFTATGRVQLIMARAASPDTEINLNGRKMLSTLQSEGNLGALCLGYITVFLILT